MTRRDDAEHPGGAPEGAGGVAGYAHLVPGAFVRNPDAPDWGLGQVQSAIGTRVTVTFEDAGKLLIDAATVTLSPA